MIKHIIYVFDERIYEQVNVRNIIYALNLRSSAVE